MTIFVIACMHFWGSDNENISFPHWISISASTHNMPKRILMNCGIGGYGV